MWWPRWTTSPDTICPLRSLWPAGSSKIWPLRSRQRVINLTPSRDVNLGAQIRDWTPATAVDLHLGSIWSVDQISVNQTAGRGSEGTFSTAGRGIAICSTAIAILHTASTAGCWIGGRGLIGLFGQFDPFLTFLGTLCLQRLAPFWQGGVLDTSQWTVDNDQLIFYSLY